jgi:hypothetical protein
MMVVEMKELLNRYEELARIHANSDYGDSRSVKKANDAVDEMISISRDVGLMGEGGLEAFSALLDVSTNKVHLWAAHHILEHMNISKSLERRALGIIRENAKGDSADALGERWWLKDWEEKHKKASFPDAAA